MARTFIRYQHRAWLIFFCMVLASMLSYFHQVGLSTASAEIGSSLNLNAADLGMLASAFTCAYAAMQIPAGILADTWGSRKSVSASLILAAAGTLLFACAHSLAAAAAGRLLTGLGIAVIAVPMMKLTAVWFPPSRFGSLTAISFTMGGLGFFAATMPMAGACSAFGWRFTYHVIAALTIACAFGAWVIVRDAPQNGQDGMDSASQKSLPSMLHDILGSRQAWLLGGWYFCLGGIYFAFTGLWAGQLLINGLGKSIQEAGSILALPACAIMTAPIFTWAAGKAGNRIMLIALSASTLIFSLPLALGFPKVSSLATAACFSLLSISAMGGAAIVFTAVKELFPVSHAGTATGFINIFPFLGGAFLQHAIGFATDLSLSAGHSPVHALTSAFAMFPAAAALAFLLALLLPRRAAVHIPQPGMLS